jgi:uncharacterized protein (TIGR03435 family)
MEAYVITTLPGPSKVPSARTENPPRNGFSIEPDENKEFIIHVVGNRKSIQDLAHTIEPVTQKPVLDQTGLSGEYSFDLKFAALEPFTGALASLVGATSPTIFTVFQRDLGLRLERKMTSVDAWVIDRAEKPSQN